MKIKHPNSNYYSPKITALLPYCITSLSTASMHTSLVFPYWILIAKSQKTIQLSAMLLSQHTARPNASGNLNNGKHPEATNAGKGRLSQVSIAWSTKRALQALLLSERHNHVRHCQGDDWGSPQKREPRRTVAGKTATGKTPRKHSSRRERVS